MKKLLIALTCLVMSSCFGAHFDKQRMSGWKSYQFPASEIETFQISLPEEPTIEDNVVFAKTDKGITFSVAIAALEDYEALIDPSYENLVTSKKREVSGPFVEGVEITALFEDRSFICTRVLKTENQTYSLKVEREAEKKTEEEKPHCAFCQHIMKERRATKFFFQSFKTTN